MEAFNTQAVASFLSFADDTALPIISSLEARLQTLEDVLPDTADLQSLLSDIQHGVIQVTEDAYAALLAGDAAAMKSAQRNHTALAARVAGLEAFAAARALS